MQMSEFYIFIYHKLGTQQCIKKIAKLKKLRNSKVLRFQEAFYVKKCRQRNIYSVCSLGCSVALSHACHSYWFSLSVEMSQKCDFFFVI